MATDDLIKLNGWSQQVTSFSFDLLSESLEYIGELPVMGTAKVENNINRSIKRQLTSVSLPPSAVDDINMLSYRVRPMMKFGDGAAYPLGVFVFTDVSMARIRLASRMYVNETDTRSATATLHDQLTLLDNGYDIPIAFRPGTKIVDAISSLLERMSTWSPGIQWEIPDTESVIRGTEWFVKPPGSNLLSAVNELCSMGGFYSIYVDNAGVFQVKPVPEIDGDPEFVYRTGTNVFADSIVESNDLLDIPNRYVVINSALTDTPVYGKWDVPSEAAHSIQNRGRIVSEIIDLQGVDSNAEARAAAKARATRNSAAFQWVDFDASPDPRHDTFNLVEWGGNNFREQSWGLTMTTGGPHHHELRRTYNPDEVEEDPLESDPL